MFKNPRVRGQWACVREQVGARRMSRNPVSEGSERGGEAAPLLGIWQGKPPEDSVFRILFGRQRGRVAECPGPPSSANLRSVRQTQFVVFGQQDEVGPRQRQGGLTRAVSRAPSNVERAQFQGLGLGMGQVSSWWSQVGCIHRFSDRNIF